MSKTLLVTGAAGFIGSHVAQALLARGDTVVGLDNLNGYYDPARKRANLVEVQRSMLHVSRFTFIEGDIRDHELIRHLFEEYRFDAVVHLAAMAGVRVSIEDPALYYDVNLTGTLVLLDAAIGRSTFNVPTHQRLFSPAPPPSMAPLGKFPSSRPTRAISPWLLTRPASVPPSCWATPIITFTN